jgi:hypothetical protein
MSPFVAHFGSAAMSDLSLIREQKRTCRTELPIPRQLSLPPMRFFPVGIEHPFLVPVQRSHDADPGQHGRAAARRDQD